MKKTRKSQQNSLDAFLSGKSYNTKKETSKNDSKPAEKPEKKEKIEPQEKIPKKSKKLESVK